jgi:serine/threonine protein kinase
MTESVPTSAGGAIPLPGSPRLIADAILKASDYAGGDKIREGSWAAAFKVSDPATGEPCVARLFTDPTMLEGYLGERWLFRVGLMVICPGVVRLRGVLVDGGAVVGTLTDFVPKGNLADLLERHWGAPFKEVGPTVFSKIIFGVAVTLSHLHACRVIHCNLKPAKIFLDEALEPVVNLSDITTFLDAVGETIGGTPLFMAPELDGDMGTIGLPIDAYAFAVTLYSIFAKPGELDDKPLPARTNFDLWRRLDRGARFKRVPGIPDPI